MIEEDIVTALAPLVAGRVHPIVFPQPPATPVWPAIRYTLISRTPVATICGSSMTADDDRFQLDVVAPSYSALLSLVPQVKAAAETLPVPAVVQNEFQAYDAETKTYRALLDFIVYHSTIV
jgi:hypothetical protein